MISKVCRAFWGPLDPAIPPQLGLAFLEGAPMENISGGRIGGDSMSGILK